MGSVIGSMPQPSGTRQTFAMTCLQLPGETQGTVGLKLVSLPPHWLTL